MPRQEEEIEEEKNEYTGEKNQSKHKDRIGSLRDVLKHATEEERKKTSI